VKVIGDEPANTINDRRRRRLLCRGAKESYSPCRSRVRDERGWETERCRMVQATAPILNSTEPDLPRCPLDVCFQGKIGSAIASPRLPFLTQIGLRCGSTNAGRSALSTSTITIDHAAPRDVPIMHNTTISVDMTIVCLDILEKMLSESRESHGQHPFRWTWWHRGWVEAHPKAGRTRTRSNSPPPRNSRDANQHLGKMISLEKRMVP